MNGMEWNGPEPVAQEPAGSEVVKVDAVAPRPSKRAACLAMLWSGLAVARPRPGTGRASVIPLFYVEICFLGLV